MHKFVIICHILCDSPVGTSIHLHPTTRSQVRSASPAVWRSATGGRLPAALSPRGFGMSRTFVAFTLLDYFFKHVTAIMVTVEAIQWITCGGELVSLSLQLCMSVAPNSSTEEITADWGTETTEIMRQRTCNWNISLLDGWWQDNLHQDRWLTCTITVRIGCSSHFK